MKLIDTKEYKGFKTEFFLLPKTEKFLLEQEININDYLVSVGWKSIVSDQCV